MATGPTTTARSKSDGLPQAIERLEAALTAAVPGREQAWADETAGALRGLEGIMQRHIEITEAADGMFSEVDLTRPTLTRKVSELRREHRTLMEAGKVLYARIQPMARAFQPLTTAPEQLPLPEPADPTGVADFATIRDEGLKLLADLKKHKESEVDVLLESVDTDIGVGD